MVERTLFGPGGSTETKQDTIIAGLSALLTELQQKLETGQAIALDAGTLAALETIIVSGTVALDAGTLAALETIQVGNFPATQPVTGPLTDTQLRAAPVPVSFPADEAGLTDAELRATPVPVSGTVSVAEPVTVDGTVALDSGTLTALETITVLISSGQVVGLDAASLAALESITAAVSGTVAVSGSVEVVNDVGNPLPVSGFPADQKVHDDYQSGECLADQTGAGAVLTFTFTSPVQLVVVDANGAATDVARADPFGGTPTASLGVPCRDEAGAYMPVSTSVVRVFAPVGMIVSVVGYRRT